jgi:hypothetical protein
LVGNLGVRASLSGSGQGRRTQLAQPTPSRQGRKSGDLGLNGKVAVVTGARKGIGLAVTRGLLDEGVHAVAGAAAFSTGAS